MTDCLAVFDRPGGLELTMRASSFLPSDGTVLDVGCGKGCSVAYLNERGFHAHGVDCDESAIGAGRANGIGRLCKADASVLPFADERFDGVLFECSLSKIDRPEAALSEAFRVMKPSGRLAVSDFFSHTEEYFHTGVLGRVETIDTVSARLTGAGFLPLQLEDWTETLRPLWGQLVFDLGRSRLIETLGIGEASLGSYGYFLMIAEKRKSP